MTELINSFPGFTGSFGDKRIDKRAEEALYRLVLGLFKEGVRGDYRLTKPLNIIPQSQLVKFHKALKSFSLIVLLAFAAQAVSAHNINYALEKAPVGDVVWFYVRLGVTHIIPEGLDHILFVVGLCLLSTKMSTIIWQATAFTIAHSITLALSMKNIIVAPGSVVEPIIALSILFVAIENVVIHELKSWRIAIVFVFGLIHGMGFASALNEIGLPPDRFITSILSFNAGVELGQITVIAAVFLLLIIPFRKKLWYRSWIVNPVSICIALVAAYWSVERLFF
ncbi:MAG: HupE/UreJ family protein [Chitinophagaceae bacterium]